MQFYSTKLHPIESQRDFQLLATVSVGALSERSMKKLVIGAVLAASALSGCATTGEGQEATDAFVSRELKKHGVVAGQPADGPATKSSPSTPTS